MPHSSLTVLVLASASSHSAERRLSPHRVTTGQLSLPRHSLPTFDLKSHIESPYMPYDYPNQRRKHILWKEATVYEMALSPPVASRKLPLVHRIPHITYTYLSYPA
eukprot:760988-Hanusia_phi.AAC.1